MSDVNQTVGGEAIGYITGIKLEAPQKVEHPFVFEVKVPPSCKQYVNEIKTFLDAMVYKLERNAHKGKWEGLSTGDAIRLMFKECAELDQAVNQDHNVVKILLEAADVANFAMIVASIAGNIRNAD